MKLNNKKELFIFPAWIFIWLFGECESLMSDGEFGLSEDSIYLLVLPRSFFRGKALQCVQIHNIYDIYMY